MEDFAELLNALKEFERRVLEKFGNEDRIRLFLNGAIVYAARGFFGIDYNFENTNITESEAKEIFSILKKCLPNHHWIKVLYLPPSIIVEIKTTYAEDETLTEELAVKRLARRYAYEVTSFPEQLPTPILFCKNCGIIWEYNTSKKVRKNLVTGEIVERGNEESYRYCSKCGAWLTTLIHKTEVYTYLKKYILDNPTKSRKEKIFLQELAKEGVLEASKLAAILI